MVGDWQRLDVDEFDPAQWPEAGISHLPALDQWRVCDALEKLGLLYFQGLTRSPGLLSLWRNGRRTDADMEARPPNFAHVPRWVNCLLSAAEAWGEIPALLRDEEMMRAAEAVARMTEPGVDCWVKIRKMLTGEPAPDEGGWRRP